MYCGGDDIGALVADIGSHSARIGFAGDDYPRVYIPSCIGITDTYNDNKTDITINNSIKNTHFDINYYRPNMRLEHIVRDGIINDWDLLEELWDHSLTNYLKVDTKETPILLAEKSYNSSESRQKMCELMFEKYNAPALFMSKDAVLSCYSCGKTTGVAVDCGASGTVVTPVYEGWAETSAISRGLVGGRFMDAHLLRMLGRHMHDHFSLPPPKPLFRLTKSVDPVTGALSWQPNRSVEQVHPSYDAYMHLEMARDMKESVCRTAEASSNLTDGDPRYMNIPLLPHALPDGTVVDVGVERFLPPELLFDPSLLDLQAPEMVTLGLSPSCPGGMPGSSDPIENLVVDSILRCEADSQVTLASHLIVTGGNSAYDGMPERIRQEVDRAAHMNAPNWRTKVLSSGASERAICTWLGGSIIASLGSLHEMWMGRSEYDEYGSALIDRKCP